MPKFLRAFLAATLAIASFGAIAQSYPGRPVKMLVGYATGGGMDSLARVLAAKLTETLGQQVLVENRAGASGAVAADAMIKSLADGYTIYAAESGALILPAINPKISYDPVRNFLPVGGVATLPMAFVVTNAFPAKNAQELIAALKAAPGKYSYASPGVGTVQHFAFELFMRSAGVSAVHIPYKGAATMMPDIISGQVPVAVISVSAAMGQVKAGKIRTIALTSPQRISSAPDWPAMAETLAGFDAAPRVFVVAPVGTPQPVVTRLNEAMRAALASKDLQENYERQGATAMPSSPEELGRQIAEETRRWATIAKEANIKSE